MSRDSRVYLEDILEASGRIRGYLGGVGWEEASKDPRTFDAVVRNLEIIGEASKNLPAKWKASYPWIEWKKISGFRDVLAHRYFGIDGTMVGDIIRNKIPELEKAVRESLQREPPFNLQERHFHYRVKRKKIPAKRKRAGAKAGKSEERIKKPV